jgi:hypothetical protein
MAQLGKEISKTKREREMVTALQRIAEAVEKIASEVESIRLMLAADRGSLGNAPDSN